MSNPHFSDDYWRRHCRLKLRNVPSTDKTDTLLATLKTRPGIGEINIEERTLRASYDLRKISLRSLKRLVRDAALTLEENRWDKFRGLIIDYRESILRAEQGIDYGWDVWIQDAYVSRYRLRRHGRRDDRITNWRMYERDETATSTEGSRKTTDHGGVKKDG